MNRDQIVAGGVAAAAFACSAQHIYTVALGAGNPWPIALVHPAGIDGLIYIGMRAVSAGRKWQGWIATVYGVGMSLTFNAVSYAHVAMPPWVMAVAMPLALVLGVLVVGHEVTGKRPVKLSRPRSTPVIADGPLAESVPVAVSTDIAPVLKRDSLVSRSEDAEDKQAKALRMIDEGRDKAEVAETIGVSTRTLNRWIAAHK